MIIQTSRAYMINHNAKKSSDFLKCIWYVTYDSSYKINCVMYIGLKTAWL